MAYSAVRVEKLKVTSQFQSIELHGRRLDASSERRADKTRTANSLSWSKGADSLDVMGALAARKAELGDAKQYGKAAMGAHFLLTVSPSWIAETGDIHDPKNPRNQKLFEEAKAWAETHLGKGSVIAMRMDMDEAGGGVVDVVAVPSMTKKVGGKEVSYVSLNRAFEKAFGKGRKNYVGMQDSWAKHCQKTLDPEIKRGVSKEITQKEHVHAEIIAPALQQKAKVDAEKEAFEAEQKAAREAFEAEQRTDRAKFEAEQEAHKADREAQQKALDAEKASVEAKNAALAAKEAENAQWVIQQKKRLQRAGNDAIRQGIEQGRRESIEEFRNKSVLAKIASYRVTITDEALAMAKSEGEMRVRDEFAGKVSKLTLDLTQEREKRKALEQKNVKTLNALNDANAKLNALEVAVAEIAEQIPRNAFMRLREAIGRSKMLDDIMQVLGIQKDSRHLESGRGPTP